MCRCDRLAREATSQHSRNIYGKDISSGCTGNSRERHGRCSELLQISLGFQIDWRSDDGGISGVSRGDCRIFLSTSAFRRQFANSPPVVTWINCDSKAAVNAQQGEWHTKGVTIIAPPESKPWLIHEFTASVIDGNVFRVFYDSSRDT